jgi:uncharacterized protein (DUF1778 family)
MAEPRTAVINLRADERRRALIDRAAEAVGKNRSEFMLDASAQEATRVLLDRRYFELESHEFSEFLKILDAAPKANARLRKLLRRTSPWER